MLKKLSMVGLCGASLIGLVGCVPNEPTIELAEGVELVESSGSVEFGEVNQQFDDEMAFGLTPTVLFEALNKLEPELALNESVFEEIIDEWGGRQFVSIPTEKVLINYTLLQEDEWTTLKDENSLGTLEDLYLVFDKTDKEATDYAIKFMNAFNTVAINGLLDEEILEASKGFTWFDISIESAGEEEIEEEDMEEEALQWIKKAGITNLKNLCMIEFD